MGTASNRETLGFQTEVKQLLHLMVHSLYSNKEIFLRELISNASDAADKLRFEALSQPDLLEASPDLGIDITYDKDAGAISVSDNGTGMSRQEVIDNLGTIAKSGTAEFLNHLTGDQRKDSRLIGQFGVGFYSSFIVAERVEVATRRAGLAASEGVRWESSGEGDFTIEGIEKEDRGTTVTLHLRPEEKEFADGFRLRALVRKYSDHIGFPVRMPKEGGENDDGETEVVNAATALWTLPRKDISDDEYKEFYRHISHDFEEPLVWSHNRVEGKREYTSLLYIPAKAPFDLWNRDAPRGVKLYVQRVFIMDQADQFLPLYFRFVRGVVDSGDLPLNVSREILQRNPDVDAMRGALTKRVLDLLDHMATDEPDRYREFWSEFGLVIKEGPLEDFANRERLARLMRFASTHDDEPAQHISLQDYVSRMKEGQDKIYYVFADNFTTAQHSPHLEIFRRKGVEVLLLSDRIDELLMSHLAEFDGKAFQDVSRGELNLDSLDQAQDSEEPGDQPEEAEGFLDAVKESLGERVKEVRSTRRLTDSPSCLVVDEDDVSAQMRRIMEAAGQAVPAGRPILELNLGHPLVQRLEAARGTERFGELATLLFEQAALAEGGSLEDPAGFVMRLNRLLLDMTSDKRIWTPD